jgi:ATP-dependent Clp protease ATP-binding subunit ClpC
MKQGRIKTNLSFWFLGVGIAAALLSMQIRPYRTGMYVLMAGMLLIALGVAGLALRALVALLPRTLSPKLMLPVTAIVTRLQRHRRMRITGQDAFARLIGQDHVLGSLREISALARAGIRLSKPNAPLGVLLFLGPTGVGKTEAAKAMAQAIFGSEAAMVRFDMGQFKDEQDAARFYGPPPGYIGSEEGGQLTRAISAMPRCVLLLDEVEKAHPTTWDAFLNVFDEGYVMDASFNTRVDMTQTMIVLTSNLLGNDASLADQPADKIKAVLQDARIRTRHGEVPAFRPELLGRIGDVFVFQPLSEDVVRRILRIRLNVALAGLRKQGVKIACDDQLVDELAAEAGAAAFGVRQVDDVIRRRLRKMLTNGAEHETISSVS